MNLWSQSATLAKIGGTREQLIASIEGAASVGYAVIELPAGYHKLLTAKDVHTLNSLF